MEISFQPPEPSRQDWGIFKLPYTGELSQDIKGKSEKERGRAAFKNIMQAAAYLFEKHPMGLFDLVRLLGRAEQTRRMALTLPYPTDVPGDYRPDFYNLWFGRYKPLSKAGEEFEDLAPQEETELPIRLTTADLIMPESWSKQRLLNAVSKIGVGREWGAFKHEHSNHIVELWRPIRVGWVLGGNHSLTAGILRAEVDLTTTIVRDISKLYDYIGCDGEVFFRLHDGGTVDEVRDHEWAAIFEIGRYVSEAYRRRLV